MVSGGVLSVAGALAVTAALPMLWRYDSRDAHDSRAHNPPA